ncbi:MAG TPA: hypothetical protein VFZ00_14185 [Solirubrobacter sp.]|jgi:hypothetical protein|nr:hypothetical protein [Solirubrobacter sp.]
MPLWLIIVLVVLLILIVGGIIARNRQLARSRPEFERVLAQVDHDLAAAFAQDRGWDRELLEAAVRRISAEQFGAEPDELTLIEVIDKPGTDEDQAVFDISTGGQRHRVTLGRRDGDWVAA